MSSRVLGGQPSGDGYLNEERMGNEMKRLMIALIAVVLGAILFLYISGCASTENRREQLQNEHPDCYVMHDLRIECPNPFVSDEKI